MEQQDIRDLRVGDIMQSEWPMLAPDQTVEDIIKTFAESGVSGAPVVENGVLVGIVTEGDLIFQDAEVKSPGFLDILGGLIPLGSWDDYREETLKSAGVTVDEVMTSELVTVAPDTTLTETATIMADKRMKILPVAEGDMLRGIVTRMDILKLHVLKPRQ